MWIVADDVLRGLFKPHEYGDITLPFLVLRRLDCILDEDRRKEKAIDTHNRFKDLVPEDQLPPLIRQATGTSFYNTSQYDLSRLADDSPNIRLNFENYIGGFSQDVRDIIENFNRYFYQYTPLRSLKDITDELLALERESEGLLSEVLGV